MNSTPCLFVIQLLESPIPPTHPTPPHKFGWRYLGNEKSYQRSAGGEISSDLYRDQFLRKFLNFSPLMFIYMFFFYFWGAFDDKIHFQAQQRFFPDFTPIFTCLMSGHDN